jgi:hypothetical protein
MGRVKFDHNFVSLVTGGEVKPIVTRENSSCDLSRQLRSIVS